MKKKWYNGKVFAITGASGEIGSEVCRYFAPLGMRMYLLDLPNPALDALVEEMKELGAEHAEWKELDVTNEEQVRSVMKYIGEKEQYIDVLHNNAGIGSECSITNGGTMAEYLKIMDVNINGIWRVLLAAEPYLGRPNPSKKYPDRREGQLIFTSSSAGKVGIPHMAAYCSSKHAIIGLADSLRLEYQMYHHKMHVLTVCPAPVKTKFWDSTPKWQEWLRKYESKGFPYTLLKPEDVAKAIYKAAKGNKKEIYVPRWYKLIKLSRSLAGRLLIKVERSKLEYQEN
ncbi:MAG: SDR family NAD(P)-dependent oxidoreductase [Candidatus Helarchaeota archaeon]